MRLVLSKGIGVKNFHTNAFLSHTIKLIITNKNLNVHLLKIIRVIR
jgi:hypothetical protein